MRTAGAARLTTFCARTSGSRSAASVKSCTTRSTSVRQTSPVFGTIATSIVRRPPKSVRISRSMRTKGWFAGSDDSTLNSVCSRDMPLAIASVATATATRTSHARRTRKRT
jgi:hypothetical protein